MWSWLFDIANTTRISDGKSSEVDFEVLEGCVGIMWALCRVLTGLNVHIVSVD